MKIYSVGEGTVAWVKLLCYYSVGRERASFNFYDVTVEHGKFAKLTT